jgi:hypothetical protein
MSKPSEIERRYDEKELALILKLAAKRQAVAAGPGRGGLSLAEIQQIAAEAGLDPQHVAEAAAALETQYGHRWPSLLGPSTKFLFERTIPGEVPTNELSEIIEIIRRVTGVQGEVSQVFDSVEWKGHDQMDRHTYVTIKRQGGQTKIKVRGHWWGPVVVSYVVTGAVGLMGALGLAALIEPSSAAGITAFVVGAIGSSYATARTIWQFIARRSEKKLAGLAAQIEEAATAAVAPPAQARIEQVEVEPPSLPEAPEDVVPRPPISTPQRT